MSWKPYAIIALVAAIVVGVATWSLRRQAPASASAQQPGRDVFAAPGRVEGAEVAVSVGAGATGIIREILVAEGEAISAGQVLARLECDDLVSEAPQREAEARAAAAHAEVVRLGPRPEEIEAGAADLRLTEARLVEATIARQRNAALFEASAGTRRGVIEAERDERIAAAQQDSARERLQLLRAGPRPEEVAEAQARAEAARRGHAIVLAQLAKCEVRSPITGTVLRKVMSAGELASVTVPQALVIVADTSRLRVRAEVDEEDVDRLVLGQAVTVVTAHWQGARLLGRVVDIGRQMGRRRVMTNDPAERSDRDVLESIVEIDTADVGRKLLPVGLRVSVLFGEVSAPTAQR